MSAEENRATISRLYEEIFKDWNVSLIDELFSPSFVDHLLNRLAGNSPKGPASVHRLYETLRSAFPDLTFKVHDIVADGDKVAVRWRWNCTHLGSFRGIPPTGRKCEVDGMAIYRLVDRLIEERWVSTNLDKLAQELGSSRDQ